MSCVRGKFSVIKLFLSFFSSYYSNYIHYLLFVYNLIIFQIQFVLVERRNVFLFQKKTFSKVPPQFVVCSVRRNGNKVCVENYFLKR